MKILLADDHKMVRQGLIKILTEAYPYAEITEVDNATDLFVKAVNEEWSIIISDITMPGNPMDSLKRIREVAPENHILMLSMHSPEHYALRAIKAGASGYLTKDSASEELVIAINQIMKGKKYITPEVADILATSLEINSSAKPLYSLLSNKELTVFQALVKGTSVSQIAEHLNLSVNTISTYRSRILDKLGLHSNADLVKYAIKNNLIDE